MARLQDEWTRRPQPGAAEKISDVIRPKGPLKPRVQSAIKKLRLHISRLDSILKVLQDRDEKLFGKVVAATQRHDAQAAKVLGGELAEVRKVVRIMGNARVALEQIEMRLTTCNDLGDTVVTIMPTVGLMKGLKASLGRVMPTAEQEIGQMADMLGGLMAESFAGDTTFGIDGASSEESESILKEAAAVAGSSVGDRFPSAPAGIQDGPAAKFG